MSTRRPPVAPKAGQQPFGPLEGQQIILESHTPSPRKGFFSDYGSLGSIRPRSPKPAEVRNAAVAEIDGDGREHSKHLCKALGSSPASSPSRRRGGSSVSSITMSTVPLNSLSPRTSNSILNQNSYKTLTFSGVNGPSQAIAVASTRVLSALDEHRMYGGSPADRLCSTAPLPGSATRKSTSAPDSQSAQAQFRTVICPWSSVKEHLTPLQPSPLPPSSGLTAMGQYTSPGRLRGIVPPSPPLVQNLAYPSTSQPPPPMGYGGHAAAAAAAPTGAFSPPLTAAGAVRQRRDSISSTDSHSPGVAHEVPGIALVAPLRVMPPLCRVGSPNSGPSTPSSSQPHTPVGSSLKPKPPPGSSEAVAGGRGSARKISHLASPELKRYQQQQQNTATATPTKQLRHQPPPQQQQQQQQQNDGSSLGHERQLVHMSTALGIGSGEESAPVHQVAVRRSLSLGTGTTPATNLRDTSQPDTPTSASRPGSGRCIRQPVAMLMDAVRTKDESKLAEVLDALRGPQGVPMGINERHPIAGRTPLHEAAMTSSSGMVALLLQAGADPNVGHETQGPPLLHAAAYGDVEVMRLLLDEGAEVNAVDAQRETALHLACVGRHVDAARLLTKYGALWSAVNDDNQTPVQLAPPEFMRLYTYEQSRMQPSPPYPGHGSGGGGGSAAVAAASAAAGGLYGDLSYSGVDVAPSPERPSSRASSQPASAATTPGARAASAVMIEGVSSKRIGGRPHSGAAASTSACGSANESPNSGPLLSPTAPIDLCGGGGGCGGVGTASQPASAGTGGGAGVLRPVPPPEPSVSGNGGSFRSRRNSASAVGIAAGVAAPGGGGSISPPVPPGFVSTAAEAIADADAGNRAAAPASPLLPESDGVPASPPVLRLPGGVRRQLSRGAGEGDILGAFQAEDAEILHKSLSEAPVATLDGPSPSSNGPGKAAITVATAVAVVDTAVADGGSGGGGSGGEGAPGGGAVGFFPPFQPPPGLPAGPSAALAKGKLASSPSSSPSLSLSLSPLPSTPQGAEPQQWPPPFRINVPETSVIRFGVRLQVHGSSETCETPTATGAVAVAVAPSASGTASTSASASLATAGASECTATTSKCTAADASTTCPSPASSSASDASTATSSGAAAGPGPPRGGALAMPSFSAGVAPGLLAAAAAAVAAAAPAAAVDDSGDDASGGSSGCGVTGFLPVPATGFKPPPLPPPLPPPAVKPCGGAAAASRASGTGDDGCTPPLVRDSSPIRDCRAGGDGAGGSGGGGEPAGGRTCSGERDNPQRASILAAKALKRMSPVTASKGAMEVRAANMFRQSTDLRTGEIEWTQGELLGEGAFGKVYAGLNQQTGELMAVKVLPLINHQMNKEAALQQLKDLENEMSLYKKLRNKHVVGFIDARYDQDTSAYYIFLEYVPGGSISFMLKRFKRFSEELVRNYTRQLLTGLEYLHSCKIVHRDLKGGNVLVSRDGVVKLTDFGASKAYPDKTIKECMKSVRGSVYWMAPEVIRGTGYDRRADIWSLGCTVIEMLSGTHPWPNLDNQWTAMFTIAKTEEGPPRPINISPEAARFLDRCLQFDPAKRPTARELLQDPFVAQVAVPSASAGHAGAEERLQHSF